MWEATFDEDSETEFGGATPAHGGGPSPTSRMVASKMDANPHEHSTLSKIYHNNQLGSILNKEQTLCFGSETRSFPPSAMRASFRAVDDFHPCKPESGMGGEPLF